MKTAKKFLKGTSEAKNRASKAAIVRWKKHSSTKQLETLLTENKKIIRQLCRNLEALAIVSGISFETVLNEFITEMAQILNEE